MTETAMIYDVVAPLVFVGYLLLGWWVTRTHTDGRRSSRRAVTLFLLYAVGVNSAVGFSQRDLFPFHDWPLIPILAPDTTAASLVVGVDSAGREHDIDERAWQPVGAGEIHSWLFRSFVQLDPAAQRRTAEYLLLHAEEARAKARKGHGVGTFDRFFGRFTAPPFLPYRKIWRKPEDVPALPFVGLRWYREDWNVVERLQDPGRAVRTLLYEYEWQR